MTIPFSGKYVLRPGAVKSVNLQFRNTSGRDFNDLLIYVFPTSIFTDTPDIVRALVTHDQRPGDKTISAVDNSKPNGKARDDFDKLKIDRISPPIKATDTFNIVLSFEDEFEGDEGLAVLATLDGDVIGSNDPATAAVEIPSGPDVFDLIIDLLKMVPFGSLLSSVGGGQTSSAKMLAKAAAGRRRLSQRGLLEVASVVREDAEALEIVLDAARSRLPTLPGLITVTADEPTEET